MLYQTTLVQHWRSSDNRSTVGHLTRTHSESMAYCPSPLLESVLGYFDRPEKYLFEIQN